MFNDCRLMIATLCKEKQKSDYVLYEEIGRQQPPIKRLKFMQIRNNVLLLTHIIN